VDQLLGKTNPSQPAEIATAPRSAFWRVQDFLAGAEPGPRGLRLSELLAEDDGFFEECHDFVQWLFPLNTPSEYHLRAPVLEIEELAALSAEALEGTEKAFDRMMSFYGLVYDKGRVTIGPNWDKRMQDWAVIPTHNSLRLTRILRSLSLQGHHIRAQALLGFLLGLFADANVPQERRKECLYWKQAVMQPWASGLV
jgi:hypothetical protein